MLCWLFSSHLVDALLFCPKKRDARHNVFFAIS